ncbi:GntR family transcriptional regulator [Saccharothrix deserti]|uniref:GntR family transcriptional regulator n=1 Tax=Saccharothrix deserti TaxID=2593674 RepID=UPI00131CC796|nr:GntR family transcriptional regulator [Saccharothrix deserti]
MTSGFTDARPLQVQVADDVRLKIESGEWPPGHKLPSFDDLAAAHGCSLAVVRKAIDLLKQQGLIVTMQGSGTFVRSRPVTQLQGIERYSRSLWESGKTVLVATPRDSIYGTASQEIRALEEVPASKLVADRLGIEVGTPVWARRRTTAVDGRPNQLADSYYELDVVRGTAIMEPDTGPGGGFARLEENGYRLAEVEEELSTRMPTGPESVSLQLPPGTPVLELVRTVYDDTGRAVEVMVSVIAGDTAAFRYRFPIPD